MKAKQKPKLSEKYSFSFHVTPQVSIVFRNRSSISKSPVLEQELEQDRGFGVAYPKQVYTKPLYPLILFLFPLPFVESLKPL